VLEYPAQSGPTLFTITSFALKTIGVLVATIGCIVSVTPPTHYWKFNNESRSSARAFARRNIPVVLAVRQNYGGR